MLHVVPESRISAEEALTHSYFKGFSVEELINIPISEQMMNYNSKSKIVGKDSKGSFAM